MGGVSHESSSINMCSLFDAYELSEHSTKKEFLQETKTYEEIPASAARKTVRSVIPDRTLWSLLPNLKLATQWKPIETITDPVKPWRITFNQPISLSEENWYNGKILDEVGNEFAVEIKMTADQLLLTPIAPYESGKTYTVVLSKELYSARGISLGKDIYQQFVYQSPKPPQKPEITEVTDLYSALYLGLKNIDSTIYVDKYTKDSKVAFAELEKVLRDHPEIFYYQYRGSLFWSDGRLEAKYAYSKDLIKQKKAELQWAIDTLYASVIKPGMTEYEKVKAVHDYVVLNTAYDYDNYLNNTIPNASYTMYGVLVNKTAVCNGYGLAMVYLLNQLGIDTIYVISNPSMNHGWNKVKIDNVWYNLDSTWDDPVPDRKGKVGYGYFLVSDKQLARTHSWDNTGLPKAVDTRYEYMSKIHASDSENGWIYYANKNDNSKLYKIKSDGSADQKLANVRANEIAVYNNWIYFSNYSNGGYLYKMRTDGSYLTEMTDFLTSDLRIENETLYFTDTKAKQPYRMDIE